MWSASCGSPARERSAQDGAHRQEDQAGQLTDEIPAAYQDIDQVMAAEADLVEAVQTLRQVLNYQST